ncbi:ABC transporter permease [Lactococcus paracarnosus]|uniref:ABC transporter permease n=1 Tax=Pseudolactococcus paracarnosus TaxID=2749962 RepID=A0A7L4WEI4_9LACT|nr:branched-chain amino acid ABC transporter permease [Lactococcus paracarnosus]SPC35806.1 ABC transporter permease protein [Lactococcus piscium]MCJ1976556.1 ABC transporter permease [Lactococcus paracarnosus]MCJ1982653.1 ABC transporter permease [Lactococcus paracarnosus]MCJ1994490.1 ABC transporter permease [Lactococcus paracarnosus]MCJ1999101.1 ABC transporter permease [Lactococcus paracarnosus]
MIVSTINQGLLWAILGLGIFLTFRILNFPDMTAEGSFPLGGAVAVTLITQGVNPLIATVAAFAAGCAAGFITGLLYTKGKIPTLLAGILVMTSCNSVMLMVMGRANLGLLGLTKLKGTWVSVIAVVLVLLVMFYFLNTNLGQAFIATGDNVDMAKSFGIHTDRMELLGLVVSNGIIALSGALISQNDGYADVSKGLGVIVIGLASIIIGEVLFGNVSMFERLIAIVIGAICYQFLILLVIKLGFNTNYLKLFSAIILAGCLMIPTLKAKVFKGVNLNAN